MRSILLVGIRGSGKTTLQRRLCKDNKFNFVKKYTTRRPREDENSNENIFIRKDQLFHHLCYTKDLICLNKVKNLYYNGLSYDSLSSTKINVIVFTNLDNAKEFLRYSYASLIIFVNCNSFTAYKRTLKRKDKFSKTTLFKSVNDKQKLIDFEYDLIINNENSIEYNVNLIKEYILDVENGIF